MLSLDQLKTAALDDVLEAQYGALARWQARALGLSDDAYDRRVTSGAFELRHTGVAVAQAWRYHELAPSAAALLRAGPGAHLSLWSAGLLHKLDLRGSDDSIHLWVPHADRRPAPAEGLVVRRSSHLSGPLDVTVRRALPVTTVERTVVDRLAAPMSSRDQESLLAEVLQKRRTTPERLSACAVRHLEGAAALRSLLGVVVGHDSGSEIELNRRAVEVGLICQPLVTVVHPDGTRDEVDLLAVAAGVNFESDGWAFHRDPAQREQDDARDERLRALGLVVLRFTGRQIWEEPDECRRRIRRAMDGRTWTTPPGVVLEFSAARAAA